MIVFCLLTSDFPSENPHSQTRTFYTRNVSIHMKIGIFTILFLSLINFSFCQENDFNEIEYDQKLQIEQRDTLSNIGKRLTGKWKYLGKKSNGILTDTISVGFRNESKIITTIENGIVFETEGNKKSKANYFYELTYSFENGKSNYSVERIDLNKEIIWVTSCQPLSELIYYEDMYGILLKGMAGDSFYKINKLTSKSLVLENGKEYLKLE